MITKEALDEFKKIYREKFNSQLIEKDATDKALRLLNLYKTVYGSHKSPQRPDINQTNKNDWRRNN